MQPHNAVHAWVEQMQKHLNMTDVDHQQATNLAIGTFPVLCSAKRWRQHPYLPVQKTEEGY